MDSEAGGNASARCLTARTQRSSSLGSIHGIPRVHYKGRQGDYYVMARPASACSPWAECAVAVAYCANVALGSPVRTVAVISASACCVRLHFRTGDVSRSVLLLHFKCKWSCHVAGVCSERVDSSTVARGCSEGDALVLDELGEKPSHTPLLKVP